MSTTRDIKDFIGEQIEEHRDLAHAKSLAIGAVGFALAEHRDTTALVPRYLLDVTNADGDVMLTEKGQRLRSDHGLMLTEIAGEIESHRERIRQIVVETIDEWVAFNAEDI
jgi:hypothetical protein